MCSAVEEARGSWPDDGAFEAFGGVPGSGVAGGFGSSLTVQSGLRFVRRAAQDGTPVVILNRGATRGDPLATLKLEAGCSETLTALETASQLESGEGKAA